MRDASRLGRWSNWRDGRDRSRVGQSLPYPAQILLSDRSGGTRRLYPVAEQVHMAFQHVGDTQTADPIPNTLMPSKQVVAARPKSAPATSERAGAPANF